MAINKGEAPQLQAGALGLFSIVAAVIATNGPLTALIGAVPVALAMGNGISVPSVYLIVGFAYLVFSVGFVAMSRYTKNAGAFYSYIGKGLGRPSGIGAAFIAICSYNAMQLAIYAMLGYFMSANLQQWFGVEVDWWVSCFVVLAIILVASISNIKVSGRLLFALLFMELLVIVLFDVFALSKGGPSGYAMEPFSIAGAFGDGFGIAMVFVVGSYVGFETTAIYAEEAKDPRRNIPLATYIAVSTIMLIYAVSVWALIVVWGADQVVAQAAKDPVELWYGMAERLAGKAFSDAIAILMLTSLFAALLSFHNTNSRYIFSLARESVLPRVMAIVHPTQFTPVIACIVQAVLVAVVLGAFAYAGADPMSVVLPDTAAFSTIGLLLVQALTSLAVIFFFWRDRRGQSIWTCVIAPALSMIALLVFVGMEVFHLDLMIGTDSAWGALLPISIVAIGLGGVCYAIWLRSAKPAQYSRLGQFLTEA
ncbi:APC family permease [Pseudomonas boanensis]|uniref:APC family permease n=1 Tax=Metapseudomonas boanensis TaxID=2822138 RepID=UPI0035D45139